MAFDPDKFLSQQGFDPDTYLRIGQSATDPNIDFVPTEENLAIQPPQQQDATIIDEIIGVGDAALSLGTAAIGGAPAFLGGTIEGGVKELTGQIDRGEGLELAQQRAEGLTFSPRTKVGQGIVKFITDKLSVLPPVGLTGGVTPKFGKPSIPKSKARQIRGVLSDEIKAGNINAGNIAKTLDADGSLINNPRTKAAVNLLGKGDEAYSMAINFEKMNNQTRKLSNKMLDGVQANKNSGDPKFINKNRPANVIGGEVAKWAKTLDDEKSKASKNIGNIIKGDEGLKVVDVKGAQSKFIGALNEADIRVITDPEGNLIADTTNTLTNIDEVIKGNKLNNVLNRLQNENITAREAHKLKRNIRELVSYDPQSPGAVKASAEIDTAIKNLSSDLGESVSNVSPNYRQQNLVFSESIDALKKADKALGKNLMIGDDLADAKFGALAKRIATNLASKEQVVDMINSLDEGLTKRGKGFNVDIERLVQTAGYIEDIFKLEPQQARFGFQARVAKGALESATTGSPVVNIAQGAIDAAAKLSKLDFDAKMKALRILANTKKENKQ